LGQRGNKGRKEYMYLRMRLILTINTVWHKVTGKMAEMNNLIIQSLPVLSLSEVRR